jgi:hypothetical protein
MNSVDCYSPANANVRTTCASVYDCVVVDLCCANSLGDQVSATRAPGARGDGARVTADADGARRAFTGMQAAGTRPNA